MSALFLTLLVFGTYSISSSRQLWFKYTSGNESFGCVYITECMCPFNIIFPINFQLLCYKLTFNIGCTPKTEVTEQGEGTTAEGFLQDRLYNLIWTVQRKKGPSWRSFICVCKLELKLLSSTNDNFFFNSKAAYTCKCVMKSIKLLAVTIQINSLRFLQLIRRRIN